MKNSIHCLVFLLIFTSVEVKAQSEKTTDTDIIASHFNPRKQVTYRDSTKVGLKTKSNEGLSGDRKKADQLYRDLGYKASIDLYHDLSDKEKNNEKVLARMANSYRLNHETEEAEYWYAKFVNQTSKDTHLLHFAQVLQSNGKCEDAVRWYKKYTEQVGKKGHKNRSFINDCEEIANFNENENIEIENTKALNSAHLDFSPIPYKNGYVFTSTRGVNRMTTKKDNWTKDNFSDLFYAELEEDGKFKKPTPLFGEINGDYHDGVATFNSAGSVMVFTRNNNDGESKKGLIDLKIYTARQKDGYWTDIRELPFNSDEYTTCHPTFSGDGRRLYFASNRPGGYGGLDIYLCQSQGGVWSTPQNLGPTVNSAGNELFPFLSADETLYYASNGHQGLGGLDIFSAQKVDREDESTWTIRQNLGKKFNTVKDDFGFWINPEKNKGYLSSSRKKGNGGDDIYTWTMEGENLLTGMGGYSQDICVYENGSSKRLSKANITITAINEKNKSKNSKDLILTLKPIDDQKKEYILSVVDANQGETETETTTTMTNEEGSFSHFVKPDNEYQIKVDKKGYEPKEMVVSYQELQNNSDFCIPLERFSCMALTGLVTNKAYGKPMPNATVRFTDKCTGEEKTYTTSKDGTFDYCMECGCEYQIHAQKNGFDVATEFISTLQKDCDPSVPIEVLLELGVQKIVLAEPNPPVTAVAPPPVPVTRGASKTNYVPKTTYVPTTSYVPVAEWTPNMLNDHFMGDPNTDFSEGMLITLKDIYYDFNRSKIRLKASKDLDRVVKLLRTYPSMHLSVESHTDSRGTKGYNKKLSKRRAYKAKEYIISKGIAANRLSFKGFGESALLNHCKNGAKCSEKQHQENRRTEIRITKFDRADINVNHQK